MDSNLTETKPSVPAVAGRRKRSAVPIPITVTGVDKDGQPFREDSRTLVITRHGVMIETVHHLNLGTEITVENPALGRTSTGRVVWCGSEHSANQVSEIGIYLPDAESVCGIDLAPEQAQEAAATKAVHLEPEQPSPSASPHPEAAGAPSPESALCPPALPAQPLGQAPPETVAPEEYRATKAPTRELELDLTFELGRMETLAPVPGSPSFPALDEVAARGKMLADTPPAFAPPTPTAPAAPAGLHLSVEQLSPAVEAALSLLQQRIGEILPVQSKLFEEKLAGLAQQSVSQTQQSLQASAAGLEHNLQESAARLEQESTAKIEQGVTAAFDQQLASVGEQLQSSRAEVENLLARLEERRQQAQTGLQESAAPREQEFASRLQHRISESLTQQLASVTERLQGSRAEVIGWLDRLDEMRQQTATSLREAVVRLEEESEVRLEQKIAASLQQQLALAAEPMQSSRAEVESLLAQVEELRQGADANLRSSVAEAERRMASSYQQHLASLEECLHRGKLEAEASLTRLEEARQRVHSSLHDSVAQLEQRMAASVERQLSEGEGRLQGVRSEVESLLARLGDAEQRIQQDLQQSATQLERRMSALGEVQLACMGDRLQGVLAEVEAALASVREVRKQAEVALKESAERLQESTRATLEQHVVEAANRLQSSRADIEMMLAGFEETRRRAYEGLQDSAAQLEQKMTAVCEQQFVAADDRLGRARAETEGLLARLEDLRQVSQTEIAEARTALQDLGSQTVQSALQGVNEKLAAEAEPTLTEFRRRFTEMVESQCYTLSQRVASAGDLIRDWSQQAAARLGSYSERMEAKAAVWAENLQKQSDEMAAGFTERLQSGADVAWNDALERVQQTARLVEDTTVAAVQARVQKGTQELGETTATHLRQLAQENVDFVSKQLAEKQTQFSSEMSEALHHRFDELVEASSAKLHKLIGDNLDLITEQLAVRQKLLISDTTKAFRQKIADILTALQNDSGESS